MRGMLRAGLSGFLLLTGLVSKEKYDEPFSVFFGNDHSGVDLR